jgi:hypothetical protein
MASEAATTVETAETPAPATYGWLRSPSFDFVFVGLAAAVALLATLTVVVEPRLFPLVLVTDMWLLGFHHVVSTFTRLTFDTDSFRAHRFLVLGLPWIVLGGVVGLVYGIGTWVLPTIYLYWQWFHYTRQSYGIAQIYRRKAGARFDDPPLLQKGVIYLLPLWGILSRSWQEGLKAHPTFLRQPIKVLPVPRLLVQVAAVAAVAAIAVWIWRQLAAFREGRLPVAYSLYMVSHIVIFAVGYLKVEDISYGWLTINVWHNLQYILLVWMFNNNRFKNGVDPEHRFLSTISQTNRVVPYFLVCLGISTVLYFALDSVFDAVGVARSSVLVLSLAVYQAVNFHHYIVDGVIWKVRQRPVQAHLGLAS